ncbi:MAG: SgcJ/EcaC family oxidoreductase [Afipia sp.]|nr:SgcJ/EcaC family oxidoreductase [Afipia sp.]
MKTVTGIAAASFILFSTAAAFAGPAEDLLSKWEKLFNDGKTEEIVALYTPDATLFGTLSPSITTGSEGIKNYFATAAKNKTQVRAPDAPTVTKLSNGALVLSGIYEFSGTRADGQSFNAPARYSLVIQDQAGQWKIVHHHSSPRPKPPQ